MEEKINIAEILKDKPQGTKLYDLLRNIDVELDKVHITDVGSYIVCTETNEAGSTRSFGYSKLGTEECWLDGLQILFPSKSMQDWSKFVWKKGDVLGDCCAWVKDIVPINLVPAILEKNGWEKSIGWFYVGEEERGYQFSKELDDKWDELDRRTYGDLQICQCHNLRDWSYINECNHSFRFEFTYVHELQHLLYALHIDSNLKI